MHFISFTGFLPIIKTEKWQFYCLKTVSFKLLNHLSCKLLSRKLKCISSLISTFGVNRRSSEHRAKLALALSSRVGGRRSQNHATGSDEVRAHLVHIRDALASQAKAHGAQSGNCHRVAFRCPRLDHLADGVPSRVDSALGDTTAQSRLLNRRSSERKAMLASALPSRDGSGPKGKAAIERAQCRISFEHCRA